MATLTVQQMAFAAGITPAYSAIAASDQFKHEGGVIFAHFKNTGGGANTVTFVDPGKTPAGSSATNPTGTIPATTGDKMIGPIPRDIRDPANGMVTINNSAITGGTVAILRA